MYLSAYSCSFSEDILTLWLQIRRLGQLKQEQFKELRDPLLKSAADYYGKLAALLGKQSDPASQRALAGQLRVGFADDQDRPKRGIALAAHRDVLARRQALAAGPAATGEAKADVGRSLIAVASILAETGKTTEADATFREAETLLANLILNTPLSASAPARTALATCRTLLADSLFNEGKSAEALTEYRLARVDQEMLAAAGDASNEGKGAGANNLWDRVIIVSHTRSPRGGGRVSPIAGNPTKTRHAQSQCHPVQE